VLGPELQPAVESGAEKRESGFGHVFVLEGEILPQHWQLCCQPMLEIGGRFEDIHFVWFVS
jgi:hypothetical protein